jgi:hypothetical protein
LVTELLDRNVMTGPSPQGGSDMHSLDMHTDDDLVVAVERLSEVQDRHDAEHSDSDGSDG